MKRHLANIYTTLLITIPCCLQATAEDSSQRVVEGRTAYENACACCHDKGLVGAPVTGRPADWEGRSKLWDAVLFEHADAGYLKMPSRGGRENLTEYDVDAAAEYMLNISHPELPAD